MSDTPEPSTKHEFYLRVVEELNIDVTDPFSRIFANACALADQRDYLKRELNAAKAEIERLTQERDLAIAHDTQPYPTADAYEAVCAALHKCKSERNEAHAQGFAEARERAAKIIDAAETTTIYEEMHCYAERIRAMKPGEK